MKARSGICALALSAALVMASGAMRSDDAMAQADDVAGQSDAAPVATDVAAAPAGEAPVETDLAAVQDEGVVQPLPKQKPDVVDRPVKSDLNQSTVRAAPLTSTPRPSRTSTIAMPKILGSYR